MTDKKTKVQKTTDSVEEITLAVTPDFLPASQNPGGILVLGANEDVVGEVRSDSTPANPGGIPIDNEGRLVPVTLAKDDDNE